MSRDVFKQFHPLIVKWFREELGEPTDVQLRAWSEVRQGRHVLVTAPTGSGKTMAAFLWAINQLVTGAWPRGETRVLYVSPLKALNNDVRRNLITPLEQLHGYFERAGAPFPALNVQTRSGDTPGSERRRMLRNPPEILITTPESLNLLLTFRGSRSTLTGIATVILDEIHAVAGSKRGVHLITALERTVLLSGEFQRIALSATVRPLETVADFVGGLQQSGREYRKRPVSIVRGARLINEESGEELAFAHHGSLSREIRLAVEERLKQGELKAIVATNSLELGIDIGKLDSVVLIQTPRSISSAIQRIGRSGHGVGEVSSGTLFPLSGMDFVAAAVVARAVADGDIEELHPVEAPLDLLAQIILAMALPEKWPLDDLYDFLLTTYPYRNLPRRQFDLVIGMLEGKYADSHIAELRPRATVDRLDGTISTRPGLSLLVSTEGGTIPERGYFELRLQETGAKIGELDEEFVWERKLNDTFALGAQVWQITQITHSVVLVVPARKPQQIIPFWRAEELDRDFFYSEKMSSFLERCNERLKKESLVPLLLEQHFMDKGAAQALENYLKRQREATGAELPNRHHLLIEHFHDPLESGEARQVILHTLWGNTLNRPFTFALGAAWQKKYGSPLQAFYNNDGIALLLPQEQDVRQILSLVPPESLESLLRASLEGTGYFGARFRENAGRALLLPRMRIKRRMPLWVSRLRSRKLLASVLRYRDFPLLLETWRSCLRDDFDLDNLRRMLEELGSGEIVVTQIRTAQASPFARDLIWLQANKYVYQDDAPDAAGTSALGQDLLKELVFASHLRPRLPAKVIRVFESKKQRTEAGYSPDSARELIDWVKERLAIPHREWPVLLDVMQRDHGISREALIPQLADRVALLELPGAGGKLVVAIETLPEIARGLALNLREIRAASLLDDQPLPEGLLRSVYKLASSTGQGDGGEDAGDDSPTAGFLGKWLMYYGPVELSWLQRTLGLPGDQLPDALRELAESGRAVLDQFREESHLPEVCDAANLESLLRMLRRSRKPVFEALDLAYLPLFLATFQGIASSGESLEDLRERMEQLLGVPLPASAWEEEVLPARLRFYFSAWLDSLMHTSDLVWIGCGQRKLTFGFPEDLELLRDPRRPEEATDDMAARMIPDPSARYSLLAICSRTGLSAAAATTQLWKLAWSGVLSNDSFVTVRKGILNRFVRREADPAQGLRHPPGGRWNRAQDSSGNWYLLSGGQPASDVLDREEINKARVRVLLGRYGILFKELLVREMPALQWRRLFRTLRTMEMSGEILSGNFFNGIGGLQFISQAAFRMLEQGVSEDVVYWMNAVDPASLCGIGLEALPDRLPARLPSTHLVYQGARLVLVSRRYGRDLQIKAGENDPQLPAFLVFFGTLLSRDFNPRKRIIVERINGVSATASTYKRALKEFGFQESYDGLELVRRY